MLTTLVALLPVVAALGLGCLLRRQGSAGPAQGELVFRIAFTVCLPALLFTSIARVVVTPRLAVFALAAPVIVVMGYSAARVVARAPRFTGTQIPVAIMAGMMVNAAFALPFVQAVHGDEGVARVAVFDAVNATLTFTWAAWTAARGNPTRAGGALRLRQLLRSPPLHGIGAGALVNVTDLRLPTAVHELASTIGAATGLLLALGIGMLLTVTRQGFGQAAVVVSLRVGTGLAAVLAIVQLFGLEGVDRGTLLLLGVAPVAFVSVTFASQEQLDVPLASATLSLSLLVSAVLSLTVAVGS